MLKPDMKPSLPVYQPCWQRDRQTPIPTLWKMAYSTGAWVDGIASNAVQTFALFYITAVLGLSGALAGLALSVGLLIDAAFDPLIGSLSDGKQSRLGRRLPFMIAGLPFAAIAFTLFFSIKPGMPASMTFAIILVLSIVLRCSVSMFNLPFLAFGAEVVDGYVERSTLAAWRWGSGMFGGIVVIGLGFGVFFKDHADALMPTAYGRFSTCCTLVVVMGALTSLWATYQLRARAHDAVPSGRSTLRAFCDGTLELARNPTFRALFLSTLLFFIAEGATLALGLHVNTYFWRLGGSDIKWVMGVFFIGLVVGAPLVGTMARRLDKKRIVVTSILALAFVQATPIALRLVGCFPLQGRWLAIVLISDSFVAGIALSAAAVAANAMLADAADEHEYLFGHRREGLFFAGWAFAVKAASGGGALLAGIALTISHFPAHGTGDTPASTQAANVLALFSGPISLALCVLGLWILAPYQLNRERHTHLLDSLRLRRMAAGLIAPSNTP